MEYVVALIALTAMEIVLGIDNIVFIAILTGRLPKDQQPSGRRLGLALALVMRILLLLSISYVVQLVHPVFHLSSLGLSGEWLTKLGLSGDWLTNEVNKEVNEISVKDLIMLAGGLFLIWKSVHEIHNKLDAEEDQHKLPKKISFTGVLVQIALMDIIFSLDSVITAVGMVKADRTGIWVMIAAVMLAVFVMLIFSEQISHFVEHNPTLKMLALSFLILIGVMLVAEGTGTNFNKGYVYFAMAFALGVEILNLRMRHRELKRAAD
jgi:predicted tellurium resistance membrane protein TerC